MNKEPHESWLRFFGRWISDLARDGKDWKYWSGVFSMAGAACLAVAFIQANPAALIVGCVFSIYGLRFRRKGDR